MWMRTKFVSNKVSYYDLQTVRCGLWPVWLGIVAQSLIWLDGFLLKAPEFRMSHQTSETLQKRKDRCKNTLKLIFFATYIYHITRDTKLTIKTQGYRIKTGENVFFIFTGSLKLKKNQDWVGEARVLSVQRSRSNPSVEEPVLLLPAQYECQALHQYLIRWRTAVQRRTACFLKHQFSHSRPTTNGNTCYMLHDSESLARWLVCKFRYCLIPHQ